MRSVGDRAASEVVTADGALEALPDRNAGDLHALTGLELLHGQHLAELVVGIRVAELDQRLQGPRIRLLQVTELGLGQLVLGRLAEGELDGRVPVALGIAHRGDRARPGLDDRHGHAGAVVGEHLGHAELFADESRHEIT